MSTRANIVIKESYFITDYKTKKEELVTEKLIFYRHSDGYPKGTLPSLNVFMKWLDVSLRTNVQQAAGWLTIIGAIEYNTIPKYKTEDVKGFADKIYKETDMDSIEPPTDWKCGAYEPTICIHGDIEFLYIIDLTHKTLKCYDKWTEDGEGKHEVKISESVTA